MRAYAYINHGRWVADCPFCGAAEKEWGRVRVSPRVPYPFGLYDGRLYCGYMGATCEVVYPKNRRQIWRLVADRPKLNRNWKPHETIADLRMENEAHGVVNS